MQVTKQKQFSETCALNTNCMQEHPFFNTQQRGTFSFTVTLRPPRMARPYTVTDGAAWPAWTFWVFKPLNPPKMPTPLVSTRTPRGTMSFRPPNIVPALILVSGWTKSAAERSRCIPLNIAPPYMSFGTVNFPFGLDVALNKIPPKS